MTLAPRSIGERVPPLVSWEPVVGASVDLHSHAALALARGGQLDGASSLLRRLRSETSPEPSTRAWVAALQAACHLAGVEPELPAIEELLALSLALEPDELGLRSAATLLGRAFAIRCDAVGLERALGLLEDDDELDSRLLRAWCAIIAGGASEEVEAELVQIGAAARTEGRADLVIDATTLQALACAERGEWEDALRSARIASRMAQTQALPQAQYLANGVLARIRRCVGRAHLSARILEGLLRVAPPAWHRWLLWERTMSTGSCEDSQHAPEAVGLRELVVAARDGQSVDFGARAKMLSVALHGSPLLQGDLAMVRAVLDPLDPLGEVDSSVADWVLGHVDSVPYGLDGLVGTVGLAEAESTPVAFVVADGDLRRRVLCVSVGLLEHAVRLEPEGARPGRTESALSALLMAASAGMEEGALFRKVYGFSYDPPVHRNFFHVLIHRMRTQLGEHGSIVREGSRLSASVDVPLSVPDARCPQALEHSLLQHLANRRGTSAKRIAGELSLSLRKTQQILRALLQEGACAKRREGREVLYVIEDTTYHEPTVTSAP